MYSNVMKVIIIRMKKTIYILSYCFPFLNLALVDMQFVILEHELSPSKSPYISFFIVVIDVLLLLLKLTK